MTTEQTSSSQNETALHGTIARFEGTMAIISLENGQQIMWPITKLPGNAQTGQGVTIIITTAENQQQERDNIAKSILNAIFKNAKTS